MGKQDRNFVQQLAHIGFSGLKDSLGQNFNSITSLKSEADTIKSQLVNDGKTALDVFARMKNNQSSPAKKLRNWFYASEDSFGGFGDDTEEFDPGFTPDSAGDKGEDSGPRALTQDDLTDVAKKQIGEQYKMAAKQADLQIANTAEIVSAINSRSSEMTAAITKINDTLGAIVKKLDGMTASVEAANNKAKQASSITDSYGNLSLNGVFDAARQSFIDDKVGTLSMIKDHIMTGLTPTTIASMGFNKLFDKKFGFLGDRSVSNIAKSVNEAVTNAVQDGLMSLVKNEKFADFFEIGGFKYKNKDYQSFVTNTYNTKPAIFDGMTRMSIVNVIPEYLKHIEAALTHGTPKEVDDKGHLTTKSKNYFNENIKSSLGGTIMDNYDLRNKIRDKINASVGNFNTNDTKDVINALLLGYVAVISIGAPYNSMRVNASAILSPKEIAWGHPTTNQAVNYALRFLLENSNNKDPNYWAEALQILVMQLEMNDKERRKFAAQCTQRAEKMARNSIEFATNHSHKHQATTITLETLSDVMGKMKEDNHKFETTRSLNALPITNDTSETTPATNTPSTPDSATTTPSTTPAQTPATPAPVVTPATPTIADSQIGNSSSTSSEYSERDYLRGIFGILNRGINVFQVGSNHKRKTKYGKYVLLKGKHNTAPASTSATAGDSASPTPSTPADPSDLLSSISGLNFVDSLGAPIFNANAMNNRGEPDVPEVDEDGNPLSEEEIKRRKAEAKKKEKEKAKENDTRSLSEKAEDSLNGLLTGLKEVVPAVIPDNVKDKLKEHGIGRTEEDIENGVGSDSLIGKVTGLSSFKNLKSSLKEKLTGAKDKALDTIDKVEDTGKNASKKVQDKAKGIASEVQEAVVENKYLKMGKKKSFEYVNNKLNTLANTAETGVQNAGDDQKAQERAQYDQMTVQNISALVQSAGVNGSYSEQEISNITMAINGVNNKTIKQQLRKFVLPMLKQNKTKSKSDIAYDENNKGPGLIKRIVKYSGLLFKPLTKILGSGLKVLMGMSGVLLKIGGTLIKSGVKDVRYGVRSLREGIFGSKREGEESLGLVRRVVGAPGRIAKAAGQLTGLSYSKIMDKIQTGIGTALNKVVDKMGEKFSGALSKLGGMFEGLKNSKFGQFVGNTVGKIGGIFGTAGNVTRKSEFLRGFFSARDNKKAKAKKASTEHLTKATPQNKTEAELDVMNKSMDKSNSFLEKISNLMSDMVAIQRGEDPEAKRKKEAEEAEKAKEKAKQEEEEKKRKAEEEKAKKKEDKARKKAENKAKREEKKRSKMSEGEREEYDRRQAEKRQKAEKKAAKREAQANNPNSLRNRFKNSRLGGAIATAHGEGSTRFDLGKTLGGITSILGGIGKIVLGAITSLAGFKSLMNMVTKLLSTSLVPLNKAFNKLTKVLKPVMKNLSNSIKLIAKSVSDIVISLVEALQPIFEDIISPLLTAIGPIIAKLGDIIGNLVAPLLNVLVNSLLMPLVTDVLAIVIPAIQIVSDAIQVIVGLAEMIVGGIMWGFGAVLTALGFLTNNSIRKTGSNLMNSGENLISSGWQLAKTGITGLASVVVDTMDSMFGNDEEDEEKKEKEEKEKEEKDKEEKDKGEEKRPQGSILEGYIGNGDVTTNNYYNYNNTSTDHVGDINNTYGSGDSQKSYGNYLGMSQHGCGPTAIADAVSRRNGVNLSAGNLARAMSGNGSYSPSRGTSVGSFISTSRALGSNVRAGGVTSRSLSGASSNNPITLLGSGAGFGTRPGNNHYVNVIGGNGRGISYVSNPMTGNVERRSTSELVSHSVLGLYGSGDEESGDYYTFPEAVQEALSKLKSLASNFLKIFTGPDEAEQAEMELENAKNEKKQQSALAEAKKILGEKYDEYVEEAKAMAYADYAEKHPKLDSESDEEYANKQERYWEANKLMYLAKTSIWEDAKSKGGNIFKNILDAGNAGMEGLSSSVTELGSSAYSSSGRGGGFFGIDGKARMATFSPVTHKETNITSGESGESPVHDFFGATGGAEAYSSSSYSNWYRLRNNPNAEGVGQSGDTHNGLDIQWKGGNEGKPLHAITGGTVTDYRYSETGGNMIRWVDDSGQYHHIYMHMSSLLNNIKAGDRIQPGQLVGYVGNTGASGGAHLHYGMYKDNGWGMESGINPLTYWHYEAPSYDATQGKIVMPPELASMSSWNAYKDKDGVREFIDYGFDAGMSPAGIATIMSTGIFEDSGKKIFGASKSLTDVTYDYNGQQAVGIMNWADIDVSKYGTTVPDQLNYIQRAYFSNTPEHERGKAVDPYRAGYSWGPAYEKLLGVKPSMAIGDPIGPRLNTDLIEGSSYFFGGALVPECFTQPSGFKYVATAADAYNWMIDEGYVNTDDKQPSAYPNKGSGSVSGNTVIINSPGDAALVDPNAQIDVGYVVKLRPKAVYYSTKDGKKYDFGKTHYDKKWLVKAINKSTGYYTITEADGGGQVFTGVPKSSLMKVAGSIESSNNIIAGLNGNKPTTTTKPVSNTVKPEKEEPKFVYDPDYDKKQLAEIGIDVDSGDHKWYEIPSTKHGILGVTGSGDYDIESNIGSSGITTEIPPLDEQVWSSMGMNNGSYSGGSVTYNISKTSDPDADKRIKRILDHTFEVSSKSIEKKLQMIIDRMDSSQSNGMKIPGKSTTSNQKLFDEHIPSQVSRLSIG